MSKIYDNAFKIGALFALTVFVSINYRRFWEAEIGYLNGEEDSLFRIQRIKPWGWPFDWTANFEVIVAGGAILNILFLAILMFVCGFIFRAVWLKISSKS